MIISFLEINIIYTCPKILQQNYGTALHIILYYLDSRFQTISGLMISSKNSPNYKLNKKNYKKKQLTIPSPFFLSLSLSSSQLLPSSHKENLSFIKSDILKKHEEEKTVDFQSVQVFKEGTDHKIQGWHLPFFLTRSADVKTCRQV